MTGFISKLFRWDKGRQQTGYEKMLIAGTPWPIPIDIYILRFKVGTEIPPHTDKVDTGEHYRLNLILKKAKVGGCFYCSNPIY